MEKKANHQANLVRLGEPRVHTNADSLEIFDIGEYQVVVKKGEFKAGGFGVYIQPDSVVPQTEPLRFIWGPYFDNEASLELSLERNGKGWTVPEKRRRITVRRFRGEWSEGLLLPTDVLPKLPAGNYTLGEDVSDSLGITHYDPDKGKESAGDNETFKKYRKYPKSIKGWFYLILHKLGIYTSGGQNHGFDNEDGLGMPVFDVDALKHYKDEFDPEEIVEITEKIHGSNARFVFLDDHMYAGSRTQWKSEKANCIWRNVLKTQPWIEEWCRVHPGYGLYGEVTPTQGEKFEYESKEPQFFTFDIRTPEGKWIERDALFAITGTKLRWVPALYVGSYKSIPWGLVDGKSAVDRKTLREGFVIRPFKERHVRGLGRLILKVVSSEFLLKDSQ